MYILAIETTGAFASVALMKDDRIVGQIHGNDRFSHLQNLMPQVETVVKENKLSLNDMAAIAVSRGPGSFTGIRIGVSSARALCQVLGIPCVEVSSLEALAMNVGIFRLEQDYDEDSAHCHIVNAVFQASEGTLICPILDARRSQIYGGGYFIEDGYPVERIKAAPYTIEEFMSETMKHDRILLLGDGVDVYGEKIKALRPEGTETAPESIRYQSAVSVARLGAKVFKENGGHPYRDVKPDYMRLAEAERKLKEKQEKG